MANKTALVQYSGQWGQIQTGDVLIAPSIFGTNAIGGNEVSSGQNFYSTTAAVVLATTGAGTVFLRPNGSGSSDGQFTIGQNGPVAANPGPTTTIPVTITANGPTASYCGFNANAASGQTPYYFAYIGGTESFRMLGGADTWDLRTGSGAGQRMTVTSTQTTLFQKLLVSGNGDPAAPSGYAIATTGSYGGGIQMRDTGYFGMRLQSSGTELYYAFGNSSSLTDRFVFKASGAFNIVPGTAPGSPVNGDIWYDNTAGKFRKREAGVTSDLGAVSGTGTVTTVTNTVNDGVTIGITNPTTIPNLTVDLGNITPTGIAMLGSGTHGEFTGAGSTNSLRIATPSSLGVISIRSDGLGSSTNSITLSSSGVVRDTTPAAGDNSTQLATTAYIRSNVGMANYRVLLDRTGSHIAARVAGTYAIPQGNPCAISGTGTLYSQGAFYFDPADYPSVDGVTAKLRLRGQIFVNDVAPTGNFTIGMYPVTRPASSGGAGLVTYTIGAATASCTAINTPAADSSNTTTSADFAMPAAGYYVLGVTTTATVAASSHLHINAQLQMRHA